MSPCRDVVGGTGHLCSLVPACEYCARCSVLPGNGQLLPVMIPPELVFHYRGHFQRDSSLFLKAYFSVLMKNSSEFSFCDSFFIDGTKGFSIFKNFLGISHYLHVTGQLDGMNLTM